MKRFYFWLLFAGFSSLGFSASYNMSNTNRTVTCGTTDNFYDPGGSAANYGDNLSYTMTITAGTAGQCLSVTFTTFTLEATYDFLYIYDGPSTASPLLGTYTGGTSPGTIVSSNGTLTFRFTSDISDNSTGWAATVACTGSCATSPILMSNTSQTLTCGNTYNFYDSGGSGSNYGNSLSYTMTITAGTAGQCVTANFTSFATEATYDFLYIYDGPSTGSTLIGTYDGSTSPGTVTSSSGTLTFRFYSDGATVAAGWSATLSCTSSCSAPSNNILMSNTSQTITCGTTYNFYDSGGSGGQYANSLSYTMTITPSNAAQCLTVSFTTFTLETTYDYLYIYDGTSTAAPLIGSYTGGTSPGTITASSGSLTFQFTSDGNTVANGWAATLACSAGCSGAPTAGTATATATSLACGVTSTVLSLTGESSGCGITYQWQSSPNNSTWTNIGGATTETYTATGIVSNTYYRCVVSCSGTPSNSVSVLITPSGCILISGGNYTISSCPFTGTFYDSGGSGSAYVDNETYTMTITAPAGSCLTFSFTAFNTESGYDYLKIFDGPNTSSSQIGPAAGYDGTGSPGTFTSSGTSVTFVFTSDAFTTDAGWAASVTCASACSGTPTAGTATATATALTCGTGTTGIGLSGATVGCGLTYQWQSSPNNSTWTNIAGATNSTYTPTVTSNTYYRCVVGCAGSANSGSVYITVTAGPSNDLCANATSITISTIVNGSSNSTVYTGSAVGTNSCATADQGNTACFTNANNVWYKFVPPVTGNYNVDIKTGTMSYPDVAVFSGACGGFTMLGCSGSSTSTDQPFGYYGSTYSYAGACNLTGGATYYIMVDSWSTDGTFTVTATSLSNDQIPTAALLANCGTSFNSSTIGATNCNNASGDGYFTDIDNNPATTYPGNCCGADTPWGMSIENESYYTFCVTSAADFSVTVTPTATSCVGPNAGTGTTLQYILYTGSTSSLTPICSNSGFSTAYTCTVSLSAGQCSYVLVDGWAGTNCDYAVNLAANPGCPLPVELISFTGENAGPSKIKLNWELAFEKDIKHYIIERSPDGNNYVPIVKVQSVGNSNAQGRYFAYDQAPLKGNNFYRLVPVDINEKASVAGMLMVTNRSGLPKFSVYPNPSTGIFTINLVNLSNPEVGVAIYDVFGRRVLDTVVEIPQGSGQHTLDLSAFDDGMYILKVSDGLKSFTQNIVLSRGN